MRRAQVPSKMMSKQALIPPSNHIGRDTPLRLDVAAAIAFPDGSITGRSLQREAERGNYA